MDATHGTATTYRSRSRKCRCDLCKGAHAERVRQEKVLRRERLAADPTLAPHGEFSTYVNWGCRCPACTVANTDKCRQYKATRRAA